MDQVHEVLQGVSDPASFVYIVASLEKLASADSQFNGESGTDRLSHGGKDLAGEAHAALERASVTIGAMVEVRGKELVDEPTVTGVNHHHLVAGPFRQAGLLTIGADDIGYLLLRQALDGPAVRTHTIAGTPLAEALLLVLVGHIRTGVLS